MGFHDWHDEHGWHHHPEHPVNVWRDEHGHWHDNHGRWRDDHGFWHWDHDDDRPHWADEMLNHAIDHAMTVAAPAPAKAAPEAPCPSCPYPTVPAPIGFVARILMIPVHVAVDLATGVAHAASDTVHDIID